MVEAHGSNIWFELSDEDLCERLGLPKTWKKGKDTLDVWIDSGCSHMAVMDARPGLDARRTCTWKPRTSTAAGSRVP